MSPLRAAPLLVLTVVASPSRAESITAETALKRYREQFHPVDQLDCPTGEGIIVCGWRKRELKSLPYPREPGEPVRLLPGEPPSAGGAFAAENICVRSCPQPLRVDILKAIPVIGKTIGHLLGRDD